MRRLALLCAGTLLAGPAGAADRPAYPPSRVADVVEVLHGTEVHDPYRWLEDGESEETKAWSDAQNARTRAVLDALPARASLHERLLSFLQVGMVGAPAVVADRVFTLEREGDQDQFV